MANLGVSVAVYSSTKLEHHRRTQSEFSLSTRHIKMLSFPSYFAHLSLVTGIFNSCGAYLRFQRIHFLNIPTISWFATDSSGYISPELRELMKAQWIVAANDWSSLLLALVFCISATFNFATVRQLRLRDRWIKETLLPVYRPVWDSSNPSSPKLPEGVEESGGRARSTSMAFNEGQSCAKRG